jgi:hypothetical protein
VYAAGGGGVVHVIRVRESSKGWVLRRVLPTSCSVSGVIADSVVIVWLVVCEHMRNMRFMAVSSSTRESVHE